MLALQLSKRTRTEDVRPSFERLFDKFGLPKAIQSDNGPPFASTRALGGLTPLSAWWVSLGIRVVRSRPGRPTDNGHFVRIDRPHLLEIAWGEAGNAAMPPGATRLRVTFAARGAMTRVELEHTGLAPAEAVKHAIGWPHFIDRLGVAARGEDPGPDPWKTAPPG